MLISLLRAFRVVKNVPLQGAFVLLFALQTVVAVALVGYLIKTLPFSDLYDLNWQVVAILLCLLTLSGAIGLGLFTASQRQSFNRIKAELAESEERFAIIFRSSPDPISLTTQDGRCVEANESFLHLLEYSRQELLGQRLQDLGIWGNPGDRDCFRDLLQREGRVSNLEIQFNTKTKQVKTLLLSAELIVINGETLILGIAKDVSDRKQTEAALKQSETFNQVILNALPDLIIRMHRDGTYLDFKPTTAFPIVFPNLKIGENIRNILPLEAADQRLAAATAALQTGEIQVYEFPLLVEGQHLWQEARVMPLSTDEVLVVIRDLTQRKQMELALQLSEARYRDVVEGQTELICRFQLDGTLTFANEAYCRYFGLDPETAVGRRYEPVIFAADRDRVAQLVNSMTLENPTVTIENRVLSHGEVRWTQWNSRTIFDEQGRFIEFQAVGRDVTERKQAEAEIQQLNQQLTNRVNELQTLFDVLPIGVAIGEDPECRVARINPCLSEILRVPLNANASPGAPAAERPAYRVFKHGRELSAEDLPMQYASAHNIEVRDEVVDIVHPDDTVIKLLSYASPLQDEHGKIRGSIGGFVDITDRTQMAEALRQSETRFRQFAETVREGFFVYEVESDYYSYVNPAYAAIKGEPYQPCYKGMSHWLDNIHPDDRDRVETGLERERQGEDFHEEYRYILPSGEVRWLRSQAYPIKDETETVVRVVGIIEDVSDRKQTEMALQESETRFRRAFDDAPIGFSLISLTGRFLSANAYYCNLLGYSEADLLALTFQEITYPADLATDLEGFQQMLAGEIASFQMEKRYITKQGTIIPTLMKTAPIRDQDGNILYFVGHIQDSRDRLKVERMKDEFISVVSHELRTPLTSIRGALGILGTGVYANRPEKAQQMLEIAINNSDRLVRLINDILDLERLQSGKVELIMQSCQVADLLQQAIDSVQAIADESAIMLSLTSVSATLDAASDAIVQTLTNLLSNAIKFSSPGGTVWLKAEVGSGEWGVGSGEVDEWMSGKVYESIQPSPIHPSTHSPIHPSNPYIVFSITDQGRGIPADKLDVIFEQFQQVDVSDAHKKGGTGLGLAICKNIVQQHGGKIWVESQIGQGSTFYFALPLGN